MPLLSTIIPHQGDDSALENTILSVLENQPDDSEVIVVHDGSYADPYQLDGELLLIDEPTDNPVRLLNVGLVAACSPVVCVLSSGAVVADSRWADAAQWLLDDESPRSAAIAVQTRCGSDRSFGISPKAIKDSSILQRGQVDSKQADFSAAPNLICGFYDRRTLLALNGWNEQLCWENADVEMALLMNQLGIHCEVAEVQVNCDRPPARMESNLAVKQMAEIAVAYGLSGSGASSAMTDLLRGCLTGNISGSVAWATGILSARGAASLQVRQKNAESKYRQLVEDRQRSKAEDSFSHYRRAG